MRPKERHIWPGPDRTRRLGFALALLSATAAAATDPVRPLPPSPGATARVTAGDRHCYRLPAATGGPVVLTLTTDRAWLLLELDADRGEGRRFRSPAQDFVAERILAFPNQNEPRSVCVLADAGLTAAQDYRLAWSPAPAPGVQRDALRARTRAAAAGTGDSPADWREAAAEFGRAADNWRRAGEWQAAAGAGLQQGTLQMWLDRPSDAVETFAAALADLDGAPAATRLGAGILIARGLARIDLGFPAEARADFRAALGGFRSAGDTHNEAEALNDIALSYHEEGRLDEALEWYQRALTLPVDSPDQELIARVNNNIGGIHYSRGDADEAIAFFAASYAAHAQIGNDKGRMDVAGNTASIHRLIGEWDAALDYYAEARRLAVRLHDRRMEARTLSGLGRTYYALGRQFEAGIYLRQALDLRREVEDRKGEAATLAALGDVHLATGDLAEARGAYEAALEIRRELDDRPRLTEPLLGLAAVERRSGALASALEYATEAVTVARGTGRRRDEAEAVYELGLIQIEAGRIDAAGKTLAAALSHGEAVRSPAVTTASRVALARLAFARGELDAARVETATALAQIESLRSRIAAPQLRATYLGLQDAAYELQTDIDVARARGDQDRAALLDALQTVERHRARTMLELLREHQSDLASVRDPELRERRLALQRKARAIAARLARAATAEPALEARLTDVLQELDALESGARRGDPRYARLTAPLEADISSIARRLGPGQALLEYDLGAERAYLFALSRDRIEVFDLPAPGAIEQTVRAYYRALSMLDAGGHDSERALARRVSEMLLSPAADFLAATDLAIVPDGPLHYLPFATLPLPDGDALLIEERSLVQPPSATLLLQYGPGGALDPEATIAILADPVFRADDPRLPPGATGPTRADATPVRLASTGREAAAIAARFPPDRRLLATGTAANRSLITDGGLAPYSILHIATHGVFNADYPLLSGITLSRYGSDGREIESFVGIYDAHHLDTSAELVVLSGCETALGRDSRAEGLVGLTHGFLYAGVPRVVASLWQVPERATAELMTRFYDGLVTRGLAPARALAEAQASLADGRRWRDPYYWGGFVLQGTW